MKRVVNCESDKLAPIAIKYMRTTYKVPAQRHSDTATQLALQ